MPAAHKDKKPQETNKKNTTPSDTQGIKKQQKQQKSKDLKAEAEKLFKYTKNEEAKTSTEEDISSTTATDTSNLIQVHLNNLYAELRAPQIKQALSEFSISHIEKDAFNKAIVYFTNEQDAKALLDLRIVPIEKTKAIVLHHPLKQYKDSLLITNLGPDMTKKELEPYLNEIAKKFSCKIINYDIIPTMSSNEEETSNTFSATAYATFSKELDKEVLEYNKTLIQGKKAGFRYVNETDLRVQFNQVHKSVTEDMLKEYAQEAGKVEYIVQAKDDQGANKPQFIVGYTSIQSVRNAMDYDGADIQGKPVRISYLRGSEKKKK